TLRSEGDAARTALESSRRRAAEGLAALRGTSAEEAAAAASDELAGMADVETDLTEESQGGRSSKGGRTGRGAVAWMPVRAWPRVSRDRGAGGGLSGPDR
ncbi:hypothetical protein THAOC_00139, partial [Thalassiosira oceanica]